MYATLLTDVETPSLSVGAAEEVCWRASRSRRVAHSTVALRNGAAESVTLVLSGERSYQTRLKKSTAIVSVLRVRVLKAFCVQSCAHSYTADFTVQT